MKTNSFFRVLALLAAVALTVPAFAKPLSKTINLNQTAKLGTAQLQAGEYRLLIDGTKATVQRGGKVVAESEGRWEERDKKYENTELVSNANGQLLELRFAGKKNVFVLNQ